FKKALRLDPKLKEQIATARKEAKTSTAPATRTSREDERDSRLGVADRASVDTPPANVSEDGTILKSNGEPRDPSRPVIGPQVVGQVDAAAWGKQSPEQLSTAVRELNEFARQTSETLHVRLSPFETNFFLFYT